MAGAALAGGWVSRRALGALPADGNLLSGRIPADGRSLPRLGLGSWLTFDQPFADTAGRARSTEVIRRFFASGGVLIDSSPMYGFSQSVIGEALAELQARDQVFSATKVWIPGAERGAGQAQQSTALWGLEKLDLLQVHNLVDVEAHLPWMLQWQQEGRVSYLGVTTSHGRRHDEAARWIGDSRLQFIQVTYNLLDREAERRLLPLALEQGKAVIINRPFRGGDLFRRLRGVAVPAWAQELGITAVSQLMLLWVISHPAVSCAIPATSNPDHVVENMQALKLELPDSNLRSRISDWFYDQV